MKIETRFWTKVTPLGPGDCWEWCGDTVAGGYGRFRVDGKKELAHRVAFALELGEIPDGMLVLHSCDNPPCCNPDHLRLGTCEDNEADKRERSRHHSPGGERNTQAKLREADVGFIRMWLDLGYTQQKIADAFGVHHSTISMIKTGKSWSHV